MKRLLPALLLTTTVAMGMQPAQAQVNQIRKVIEGFLGEPSSVVSPSKPSTPTYPRGALTRTMNLARQAAEVENGGLNYYRAEESMYGPATDAPFKDNKDGTLTYTFLGGYPAAPPAIQTVVTVALEGDLVRVDSNGPIPTAQN